MISYCSFTSIYDSLFLLLLFKFIILTKYLHAISSSHSIQSINCQLIRSFLINTYINKGWCRPQTSHEYLSQTSINPQSINASFKIQMQSGIDSIQNHFSLYTFAHHASTALNALYLKYSASPSLKPFISWLIRWIRYFWSLLNYFSSFAKVVLCFESSFPSNYFTKSISSFNCF